MEEQCERPFRTLACVCRIRNRRHLVHVCGDKQDREAKQEKAGRNISLQEKTNYINKESLFIIAMMFILPISSLVPNRQTEMSKLD